MRAALSLLVLQMLLANLVVPRGLPINEDQWYVEDPFDLKHNLAGLKGLRESGCVFLCK